MLFERFVSSTPASSLRVVVKPSSASHERPAATIPYDRFPTSAWWFPGLPPPIFTYRPWPAPHTKLFAGSAAGTAVESASRALSANTCRGLHVTLVASHTSQI